MGLWKLDLVPGQESLQVLLSGLLRMEARSVQGDAGLAELSRRVQVTVGLPQPTVREVSGAAPQERRLRAAIQAGFARRGFLRGVATARKCRLR